MKQLLILTKLGLFAFGHALSRRVRGDRGQEHSCLTAKGAIAHSGWVRGKDRHHAQAAATARGPSRESRFGREVQGQALLCLPRRIWKSGLCRPAETLQ